MCSVGRYHAFHEFRRKSQFRRSGYTPKHQERVFSFARVPTAISNILRRSINLCATGPMGYSEKRHRKHKNSSNRDRLPNHENERGISSMAIRPWYEFRDEADRRAAEADFRGLTEHLV